MHQLLLHNSKVILEQGVRHGGVLARDGRIALVFKEDDAPTGLSRQETIDLEGAYLSPGFIDIHIHGSAGVDLMETDEGGLSTLSEFLIAQGVTGYFATLVPTDDRGYRAALASIEKYSQHRRLSANKARILGVHFEGPFVSRNRCGALNPDYFRTYGQAPGEIETFAVNGALMTLAPEVDGGVTLIRDLAGRGVRSFIGHSQASPEILDEAAGAGASHITHFPNALDPLHHRNPGAVGWGLLRSDVTVDCIADFHHVHPLMLKLILEVKGARRTALISDAIPPAGLGDGEYQVWGEKISVSGGKTSLRREEARETLAGSVISLRDAALNLVELGIPMSEVAHMASLVPARAAGIAGQYGSIQVGRSADVVAFDDGVAVRLALLEGAVAVDAR